MDISSFKFNLVPSSPAAKLGMEVWIDQNKIHDIEWLDQPRTLVVNTPADESHHQLRITLKNKLPEHTKLSSTGDIVEDATVSVEFITIDDLDLNYSIKQSMTYEHDFNGTQSADTHAFHGIMGCNGTVKLNFTTPIYLWLLEHM